MILAKKAIKAVQYYANGRYLLKPAFAFKGEILISKAKAGEFKQWLEQ